MRKIGFIGLGNVGAKLAGSILRNGYDLTVHDLNSTMDLVVKDISLFKEVAERAELPLEISPLLKQIFIDGEQRYGSREYSPNIIKRLEEATGLDIRAPGFPFEMLDDEFAEPGYEVIPTGVARRGEDGAGRR